MPRETVRPELHADQLHVASAPGEEGLIPHPTVEVTFQRDTPGVGIGLETPAWRGVRGDLSSGQLSLADHLYADNAEQIGELMLASIERAGYQLTLRDDATRGYPLDAPTLGRDVLDAVTGSAEGWTGWYTWLDRAGCNRLITVVRKARDAAFGKDA